MDEPVGRGSRRGQGTLLACLLFPIINGCMPAAASRDSGSVAASPAVPWEDRSIFEDGLAGASQQALGELENASIYHIDFVLAEDLLHLNGTEEVQYTNAEDVALEEVQLRLFPNILGGRMIVTSVTVAGRAATPTLRLQDSVMIVPLPRALQPGESAVIRSDFQVTIPASVDLSYGVQAYFDGVLALAHAYPMIAVYDRGEWDAEIPPQAGDVTYADASFYIVQVDAPAAILIAASGSEVAQNRSDDRQVVTFVAGPARDFFLAASGTYEVFSIQGDGLRLNCYAPAHRREGALAALGIAQLAMEDFSARYSPYPYTEFDIVATPTQALGIEYPGLIALSERILSADNPYLEPTLVHEIAHQWFYNLVGNDQLDEPWLDESLAQFLTLQYMNDRYGNRGRETFLEHLESRWDSLGRAAIPVGWPVANYSPEEYGAIVYGRGALFLDALRDEMGNVPFDQFMRDYVEAFSWSISTADGMMRIAEDNCGCSLAALFDEWIGER